MNQKVQQQEADEVVDALRVVVSEQPLLVPMAAVAEVVRSVTVVSRKKDPKWLHGWLQWREREIPLVAVEGMLGDVKSSHSGTANALVINTVGRAKGLDFYAFLLNDLPQPAHISQSSELHQIDDSSSSEFHLMTVSMANENLIIPDLEELEKFLRAKL